MTQPAGLTAIAHELRRAHAPLEADFSVAGRQLERAAGSLGGLGRCFEALEAQLRGPRLQGAIGQLERAAGQVRGIDAVLRAERQALERMGAQLGTIGAALGRLDGTVRAVGMLTVSAKVCASGLGETREDFSAFTSEIARLFDLSRRSLEGFQHAVLRLQEEVRGGLARQEGFARTQAEALQGIPGWLAESVGAVDRRLRAGAEASAEVRERSASIARRVAESVMALQIADTTRQRVEHVEEAVTALAGHAPAAASEDAALVLAQVCHLQSALLQEAARDHAAQGERADAALRAMAADARAICRLGAEAYGTGERRGGLLGPLEASVRQALALLREFRGAQAEVDAMARGIAAAVAQLVSHIATVRGLETDLRLMSLNMTLKSGRLHDAGRTLHTIARELRSCADQTTQIVAQIAEELTSVTALAQDRASRGRSAEEAALDQLDPLIGGAMEQLEETGRQIGLALATLEGEGGDAATALAEAAAALTATDLPGMLGATAQQLLALAGGPMPDEATLERIRPLLPAGASYTMASERQVQARLGGGGASVAVASEELEDILF
jgi:hypothetical protein